MPLDLGANGSDRTLGLVIDKLGDHSRCRIWMHRGDPKRADASPLTS